MSFFRVTAAADTLIVDLGYKVIAADSPVVLSNQFSIEDLQNSADLTALIAASTLTHEVFSDGSWQSIAAVDYQAKDIYAAAADIYAIANKTDNEKLVNGSDVTTLHNHNGAYFTKSEIQAVTNGTSGAQLVGIDQVPAFTAFTPTSATVQGALEGINAALTNSVNLDSAYTNDTDGILNVDGTTKPLVFKSNNVNDVLINRTNGVDTQDMLRAKISTNEVIIGAAAVGGLSAVNTLVQGNLTVTGNITYTGTITDQTVSNLEVTNNNITLRIGAVADADANLFVNRPVAGTNADLKWNETLDQWEAGLVGSSQKIALVGTNEVLTGIYELQGTGTTSPSVYLTNKAASATVNLGSATQIPMEIINNVLCVYDKTRVKWLGVAREYMQFAGRDNSNNTNEYARVATFTSNQAGNRLIANATLVGASAQTNGAETWNLRVRKNGAVTDLATLSMSAVSGNQDATLNVNFNAGDSVEAYIDGTSIDRPVVKLEFAYRY